MMATMPPFAVSPVTSKLEFRMSEDEVKGLFTLAGIPFTKIYKLENKYWPLHTDYDEVRLNSPWWLVHITSGLIEIGWRKRVISIDWSETPARGIVTGDNVTKDETYVHAWGMPKALEYLTELNKLLPEKVCSTFRST